jgi:FkbM family methyltransferase
MSRILWRSGLCRFLTIEQDGYRIRFHPSSVSVQLWLDPLERARTPAFLRKYLRSGEIVVDVGANVGTTVLAAAVAVGETGHVHAIEANPRVFRFLIQNVELNGFQNVHAQNVAVGAEDGVVQFSDGMWDDVNRVVSDGEIEVPLRPLDALVTEAVVHLLKIDVEGYELKVLEGARALLSRTHCIYVESCEDAFRSYGYGTQEMLGTLRESGFEVFLEPVDGVLRRLPTRYSSPQHENLVAVRDPADLIRRTGLAFAEWREPARP